MVNRRGGCHALFAPFLPPCLAPPLLILFNDFSGSLGPGLMCVFIITRKPYTLGGLDQ